MGTGTATAIIQMNRVFSLILTDAHILQDKAYKEINCTGYGKP